MAGAKSLSLVVLCFLLVVATSQAACCKYNVCYRGCRDVLGGSKESCSKQCHCTLCSLPPTFVPNELGRKAKMTQALAAAEMEVDFNRAKAALEKMMMEEEELISLNVDKLTAKCKYNVCYRGCRDILGGSKEYCGNKCNCTQVTDVPAASANHVKKDVDGEASAAATE